LDNLPVEILGLLGVEHNFNVPAGLCSRRKRECEHYTQKDGPVREKSPFCPHDSAIVAY
jgi:hypothetical protein